MSNKNVSRLKSPGHPRTPTGVVPRLTGGVLLALAAAVMAVSPAHADAGANIQVSILLSNRADGPHLTLGWTGPTGAVYLIERRGTLDGGDPWQTFDITTPASSNATWGQPLGIENGGTGFYRLVAPQPGISSIEPARFAFGGAVELYVIGQCFDTNLQLRVGPLTLTNRIVVNPNLMQASFTPTVPGTYVFELVAADGTGLSSFPVECFDASAPPASVLQGPPGIPPAATHFKEVTGLDVYIDCLEIQGGGVNKLTHRGADVNPASGEVESQVADLVIPGVGLDFIWARTYRSRSGPNTAQGNRWDFSYNVSVASVAGGMEVRDGTGRADVFRADASGIYGRDEHFSTGTLTSGVFRLTFADTGHWEFHPLDGSATAGRLARIVDRNGNTMRLEYDGIGRLTRVVDTLDRTNSIAYSALGKIDSVTDFSGRTVTYAYYRAGEAGGNEGDLRSVTSPPVTGTPNGNDFPAGKTTTYAYTRGFQDARQNSLLRAITDPKGQTAHRYVYQHNQTDIEFLRCIGEQRGATNEVIAYRWIPHTISPGSYSIGRCIINDRVGNVSEVSFDARLRPLLVREFTGRAVPGLHVSDTTNRPAGKLRADDPDWFETRLEWNNDSLCTRVIHPRGNETEMVYQRAYNQNAARSNSYRRQEGNLRVLRERACCGGADTDGDGVPDTEELTERFVYAPDFGSRAAVAIPAFMKNARKAKTAEAVTNVKKMYDGARAVALDELDFVVSATDPRGTVTTATYDARGNLLETRTTERKSGSVILLGREHNERGQLTAVVHPADGQGRRRRDEFFYHASGPQRGYLSEHVKDCVATGFHLTNRFECDAVGNVTRHIDPRGFDTLWIYNALDQPVEAQTPPNTSYPYIQWKVQLSYDANDNVIRVDTENRDHTGALDAANPLWSSGAEFDLLDRPTARWHETAHVVQGGPSTRTNRFFYDGNGNLALAQSPEAVNGNDPNNVVQYQYDERDLPFQILPAPGTGLAAADRIDYDGNRNRKKVSKVEAINIKQTTHAHDGFDRPVRTTDPMGNVVTRAFDRNGNLVHERLDGETTDAPGGAGNRRLSETRYEYDSVNRPTRFRPAFFDIFTELPVSDGEATTSFTYAPNGQLLTETDDNGRVTRYAYDSAGRLASVTDPKTNVVTCAYDACDNPTNTTSIERSDLGGAEQRFSVSSTYDARGRLTSRRDNVGNNENWFFDSRDNVVRHTDPRGTLTGYTYDGLSRVRVAVGDLNGDGLLDYAADIGSAWDYDDNLRLTSTTDDNGNVTRHAYDAMDRLVATTNADHTVTRLVWSPRSNLILATDANGTVVSNSYDLLDRCVRRDIAPGPGVAATTTVEEFDYDGESRLVRAANNGVAHTFVWNSLSDLGQQSSGGLTLSATHDGVGNRLSAAYPSGRVVQHGYDALDQPATFSTTGAGGLAQLTTHAYDGPGRLSRVARANGINTRVNWNGLSNPGNQPGDFGWRQVARVNHQVAPGGAFIDTRIAAYDRAQNKILRAQTQPFSAGGTTLTNEFTYDAAHRLTRGRKSRTFEAQRDTDYVLDGNGNRQQVLADGAVQLYQMSTALPEPADFQMDQYSLSPLGAHTYDRNGNLTSTDAGAGPVVYHYDYADRLVLVQRAAGPAMFDVAAYAYDALGRRVSKTEFPPPPALPVTTSWFLDADCDGDGIIEERENGALRRTYAFPHVFDQKGRVMFTDTGETYYLHDDELGNVLALTDAAGGVIERYDYDDYGLPHFLDAKGDPLTDATGQPVTSSPAGNRFLSHGMEWDAETGFYRSGQRDGAPILEWTFEKGWPCAYFDPRTGRNMTRGMKIDGGMPNRISMNVAGRDIAGNNPWSGGGGGGGGGSLRAEATVSDKFAQVRGFKVEIDGAARAQFNPKEVGLDKSVPWQRASGGKWKTFRGGGLILHETAGVTRSSKNIREIAIDELNIDCREMTTGADWDYRLYGPGTSHWGSAKFTSARTLGGSKELHAWWSEAAKGKNIRKNITVTLFKSDKTAGRGYGLIAPVVMDKGLRFAIREGGRTVGAGQVIEIVK